MKSYLVALLLGLAIESLFAQTDFGGSGNQYLPCGTDELKAYSLETQIHLARQVEDYESLIQENHTHPKEIDYKKTVGTSGIIYTIPIVIHIIHLGEAVGVGTNISDSQIFEAISGLNDRFRGIIGSGVDSEIEFCLASYDPNGNPTTGINRVSGAGISQYMNAGVEFAGGGCSGASEQQIKSLSIWPQDQYYNIWVVKSICNGQWGGYAYFPSFNSPMDGTVIVYNQFTYASSTLAHELGHGFNLTHTFEGDNGGAQCPQDLNCGIDGDRICDTPAHRRGDCSAVNPCSTSTNWSNGRYNYMSYCSQFWPSPQTSYGRFTEGQKKRMRNALNHPPRSYLLHSLGCGIQLTTPCWSFDTIACFTNNQVDFEGGIGVWNNLSCSNGGIGLEKVLFYEPEISGDYFISVVSVQGGSAQYYYQISDCSPSGWNCIGTYDQDSISQSFWLNAGSSYYFLLKNADTLSGSHIWQLHCPSPINPCDSMKSIDCGVLHEVDFNQGFGIWDYPAPSSISLGKEKIFSFTASQTGYYSLSVISSNGDGVNFYYQPGSCSPSGWNFLGLMASPGNLPHIFLQDGETCYLLMDNSNNQPSNQVLLLDCASAPNPCLQLNEISCGEVISSSFNREEGEWPLGPCSSSSGGGEKIIKFLAPQSGNYLLEIISSTGSYVNYGFQAGSCTDTGWVCIGRFNSAGQGGEIVLDGGEEYYFLLDKENEFAGFQSWTVRCPESPQDLDVKILPNPNNGDFDIRMEGGYAGEVTLQLWDDIGRRLVSDRLLKMNDQLEWSFNSKSLSSGIYFIELKWGDQRAFQKVLVLN